MTATLKFPTTRQEGCIFPLAGVPARLLRSGEEFEIDVFLKAERWNNGQVFAKVDGHFGYKMIDPRTVEFVAKSPT